MNKTESFYLARKVYGNDIKETINNFYKEERKNIDIIYGEEDISQMIYMNIWTAICRCDMEKVALKVLVKHNILRTFNKIMLLSKEHTSL